MASYVSHYLGKYKRAKTKQKELIGNLNDFSLRCPQIFIRSDLSDQIREL